MQHIYPLLPLAYFTPLPVKPHIFGANGGGAGGVGGAAAAVRQSFVTARHFRRPFASERRWPQHVIFPNALFFSYRYEARLALPLDVE